MTNNVSIYRGALPQLGNKEFITDGGLETVFVFQKNVDLPLFASFDLLTTDEGIAALRDYYLPYVGLALRHQKGLILDTATWRASAGWGQQLGFFPDDMVRFNRLSVILLTELRTKYAAKHSPMVINGVIGPQDDGYNPSQKMDAEAAERYHHLQIATFADCETDMVTAVTMTYPDEAIGIVRAAKKAHIPVAISFTVETDGTLPDGTTLEAAIRRVDEATEEAPAYYMINCAHPSHFSHVLNSNAKWTDRIYGVRANASCKSHAELDEATELDQGDPTEFGQQIVELKALLKNLVVVGGCCGTDHRHVGEICRSLESAANAASPA